MGDGFRKALNLYTLEKKVRNIQHLEQLPDEIREPVQNLIEELATIQDVSKLNEEHERALRDELIEILTGIGMSPGDILDASDMELRVRIMQHTRRKLDRKTLERLGVSPMVLDEATMQNQGNPHVRLERLDSGVGMA